MIKFINPFRIISSVWFTLLFLKNYDFLIICEIIFIKAELLLDEEQDIDLI